MSQVLTATPYSFEEMVKNLVTEDDEPLDNMYSGVQQRALVEPLCSNWQPPPGEDNVTPRPFLANANVAVYYTVRSQRPLVPDMFLSLDVEVGPEWTQTSEPRSYMIWDFGKAPEVVVEIVSNKIGNELGSKLRDYAVAGVDYYVVYDPWHLLGNRDLCVFELTITDLGRRYRLRDDYQLPGVSLSLAVWQGSYEGINARWLRWCDADGNIIPSGHESTQREAARAAQEAARAAQEAARAEQEASRAEQEAARAERLAAKLRAMGFDPDSV